MTQTVVIEEQQTTDTGMTQGSAIEPAGSALPNVFLRRFVAREDFQFFEISPAGSKTPWLTAAEGSPLAGVLREAFRGSLAIQAEAGEVIAGPDDRPAAIVRQVEIAPLTDPLAVEPEGDVSESRATGIPPSGTPGTYQTLLDAHTVVGLSHYFRTVDPAQVGGYYWLRLWHESPILRLVEGAFHSGRRLEVTVGFPFTNFVDQNPAATIQRALVIRQGG